MYGGADGCGLLTQPNLSARIHHPTALGRSRWYDDGGGCCVHKKAAPRRKAEAPVPRWYDDEHDIHDQP